MSQFKKKLNQLFESIILNEEDAYKIYVNSPSEVPEGRKALRGDRGGIYYMGNYNEKLKKENSASPSASSLKTKLKRAQATEKRLSDLMDRTQGDHSHWRYKVADDLLNVQNKIKEIQGQLATIKETPKDSKVA